MKVAVAKMGDNVCDHFGHCDHFDIYTIEGNAIKAKETIKCPTHEPCKLPSILQALGTGAIIAGGMGTRAISQLEALGINAYLGVSGPASIAVRKLIEGTLESGNSTCSGGGEHGCGH